VRPVDSQFPLKSEITLISPMSIARDDGNEEGAGIDLLADRIIPGVAAAQFALVEPYLDAGSPQCVTDTAGRRGVLRGITHEDCLGRIAHVCSVSVLTTGELAGRQLASSK
jgi:hypothetical protein